MPSAGSSSRSLGAARSMRYGLERRGRAAPRSRTVTKRRRKRLTTWSGWLVLLLAACGDGSRTVRAHHDDGSLRSEARAVRDAEGGWQKSGTFRAWHPDGTLASEGAYRDDRPSGPWTRWYPDGSLQARGSYLFGAEEGVWVWRAPDGSVDEERSGVYEAGVRIADVLIDGVREDAFPQGGLRERVSHVDGLRHGAASTWYPDGTKHSEGRYEDGRRVGRWRYWHADGSPDGERSGIYDGWRRVAD